MDDNSTVRGIVKRSAKRNNKSTFPVLDTTHPFFIFTFSNDLDLTALFKYINFGRKVRQISSLGLL